MLLVLVSFFYCFHLLFVFYDIGCDGKVTLWERAARSGYNMFSVPCQVLTRATFIVAIGIDTRVYVQVVCMILPLSDDHESMTFKHLFHV